MLSKTISPTHYTIYKLRRCFQWMNRYYQLDIYEEPCNPSCRGLAILSTHSIDQDLLFPEFLQIESEVTNDAKYSMFNLSKKTVTSPGPSPSPSYSSLSPHLMSSSSSSAASSSAPPPPPLPSPSTSSPQLSPSVSTTTSS